MRRKLNSETGLTMVEMLCAVVILILLGLLLNTGLQMAVSTYRAIVAQSEVELLLSTAVDAVADELRYARDVSGSGGSFTYFSDSFGPNTALKVEDNEGDKYYGQIKAYNKGAGDEDGKRLLPDGAYGLNRAYKVTEMTINPPDLNDPNTKEITFTIIMKVETTDGKISAKTPDGGVTVRCLNPKKDTTGG